MKRFMYIVSVASLALMFAFFFLMVNTGMGVFATLGITAMTICYHFTIRLVIGNITGSIKLSQFDPNARRYRERKFERKLYKVLRVKKWKKFVPTYNNRDFSVKDHSFNKLARATCRAETTHWLCAAASLVTICFAVWFGSLVVFIITGVLGALVDLVFVTLQRYNRPRFMRLAERKTE